LSSALLDRLPHLVRWKYLKIKANIRKEYHCNPCYSDASSLSPAKTAMKIIFSSYTSHISTCSIISNATNIVQQGNVEGINAVRIHQRVVESTAEVAGWSRGVLQLPVGEVRVVAKPSESESKRPRSALSNDEGDRYKRSTHLRVDFDALSWIET